MLEKSKNVFVVLGVESGEYRKYEVYEVSMTNVTEANRSTMTWAGFRTWYGYTADGQVFKFFKAGRIAKRDLDKARELGCVGLVDTAWNPSYFEIDGKLVSVSKEFEHKGAETQERISRFRKALGI